MSANSKDKDDCQRWWVTCLGGLPQSSQEPKAPRGCCGKDKARQDPTSGTPLAYVRGYQDFYDRDFIVTPDVLIPRPETEQMIDAVLNLAGKSYLPGVKPSERRLPEEPILIDVGTGSGCIAITLAKELPEATIYATDVSEKAIKIAQKNAKLHGVSPKYIISHLLNNVNFTPDVVVANLPYVDKNWGWLDEKSLGYEPSLALYADDHGLALIKELIDECSGRKIEYLILEADPSQHQKIVTYAKGYDLMETRGFIVCMHLKSH
jgi:release factor glutamine methyltransferase